jgi:hypothetical protein
MTGSVDGATLVVHGIVAVDDPDAVAVLQLQRAARPMEIDSNKSFTTRHTCRVAVMQPFDARAKPEDEMMCRHTVV